MYNLVKQTLKKVGQICPKTPLLHPFGQICPSPRQAGKDYSTKFTFDQLAKRVFVRGDKKNKDGQIASEVSQEWKRLYNEVVIKNYKHYKARFPDGSEGEKELKVGKYFVLEWDN